MIEHIIGFLKANLIESTLDHYQKKNEILWFPYTANAFQVEKFFCLKKGPTLARLLACSGLKVRFSTMFLGTIGLQKKIS